MTTVAERAVESGLPPGELEIDLMSWWDNGFQVRAAAAGGTLLTALVTSPSPGLGLLQDCLPRHPRPGLPNVLPAVARRVRDQLGCRDVVAIHPAGWRLPPAVATALHRMANLGLLLDEDHLWPHHRPLPHDHTVRALRPVSDVDLSALSAQRYRPDDLRVWREVRSGAFGPMIDEASVVISSGNEIRAAIGITEYRGRPLIGHCVTGERHRGQGLGRAVLVEGLRRLAVAGYPECELNVVEDNWVAHRLYRSVGFTALQAPLQVSLISGRGAGYA